MTDCKNCKYTDEYCASGDCIVQDDLTSQWKKGELPSGWYYVRLIRGEYRIDLYINGKNEWIDCPDNIIDTIVCEVPSYDEWQASYNCMLENEVLLLKNAQLKELLRECRPALVRFVSYDNSEENARILLMNKINEVLK